MPRTHKQDLVNAYVSVAKSYANPGYAIKRLINSTCKVKKHADIEYVSNNGLHWAIEVKTHESPDFGSAVHKTLGELMKEAGRSRCGASVRYALLVPSAGLELFGKSSMAANKAKFEAFGKLIPVSAALHLFVALKRYLTDRELLSGR